MKTTEHRIQVALFKWAATASATHPELRLMFAIPNGGARNAITGALLKAEGVKSGVPDIFLPHAVAPHHGLFVEMKTPEGRTSAAQREWLSALSRQGYAVYTAYGLEEAIGAITRYLESNFPHREEPGRETKEKIHD